MLAESPIHPDGGQSTTLSGQGASAVTGRSSASHLAQPPSSTATAPCPASRRAHQRRVAKSCVYVCMGFNWLYHSTPNYGQPPSSFCRHTHVGPAVVDNHSLSQPDPLLLKHSPQAVDGLEQLSGDAVAVDLGDVLGPVHECGVRNVRVDVVGVQGAVLGGLLFGRR
jgi:hypothetical protein